MLNSMAAINRMTEDRIYHTWGTQNDNPAFEKADVSIGVRSDIRLIPELTCQYFVEFNHLSIFLKRLEDNGFAFSDKLLLNL
jgi:hypothetical protein